MKSRVVANATAGPRGPYAVYAIIQQSSSSTRVIRGSSTPQASCGWPADGDNSGAGSITQFDTPSGDRATVSSLIPRRSSTRHNSTVTPSTRAAPGFSTAFTGSGHRRGVSSGLPRARWNRSPSAGLTPGGVTGPDGVGGRSDACGCKPSRTRESTVGHLSLTTRLIRPGAGRGFPQQQSPSPAKVGRDHHVEITDRADHHDDGRRVHA